MFGHEWNNPHNKFLLLLIIWEHKGQLCVIYTRVPSSHPESRISNCSSWSDGTSWALGKQSRDISETEKLTQRLNTIDITCYIYKWWLRYYVRMLKTFLFRHSELYYRNVAKKQCKILFYISWYILFGPMVSSSQYFLKTVMYSI